MRSSPAAPRTRTTEAPPRPSASPRRIPQTPPSVPTPRATRDLAPALFAAALVAADVVALSAAMAGTYWLRFVSGWFPVPQGVPEISFYVAALAVVAPVGVAVNAVCGLYRPRRDAGALRDVTGVAKACAFLLLVLAALAFFYRGFSFSRTFLVGFAAVAWVATVGTRRLATGFQRRLRARGIGVQRVVIVGGGELATRIRDRIRARPGSGLAVVATLAGGEWRDANRTDGGRRAGRLRSFARGHAADRVIVTDPRLTHDERLDLVEGCHAAGIRVDFVPDLFEVMLGRARLEEIDGIPLVGTRLHPLGRWDRVKKRTLDIVVSGTALIALAPLLGLIALAVKADSRGPAIFRQRRVGRDGGEFRILKFRSMPPDAEKGSGPVRATKADARPTRVGRILRRTSLDELPQLWNVLRGQMSLVGPRPEREHFVEEFRSSIPRYHERHGVKSGLTGWAQVHGLRGDTSIEERTRYDLWYLENWSLRLDVKILVLTFFRFLFQEEAY